MIYLDNAATSFPKPRSVIAATEECIKKYCANSGRSSHALAVKTSEEIYSAREAVSELLSLSEPQRVSFTLNATYALNIAIKSIVKDASHVLISDLEHNAVLRPLKKLCEKNGVTFSVFSTDGNIKENIINSIKMDTKAIICTLASNVTGEYIPLEILSEISEKFGLALILDASQAIGHKKIDLKKHRFDALCAPAHKALFGIQGAGFAVFSSDEFQETLIEGGSGNESKNGYMPKNLPEHFEAGTLPSPSIVALRHGIEYINSFGIENVERKLDSLTSLFCERITALNKIRIYSAKNGIISFNFQDQSSSAIARELDKSGICVRGGLHCAPLAHQKLGSLDLGLVRVSLSVFNGEKDCQALFKALKSISLFV